MKVFVVILICITTILLLTSVKMPRRKRSCSTSRKSANVKRRRLVNTVQRATGPQMQKPTYLRMATEPQMQNPRSLRTPSLQGNAVPPIQIPSLCTSVDRKGSLSKAISYLQRTLVHGSDNMHRACVCVACDSFIIGTEKIIIYLPNKYGINHHICQSLIWKT